MSTNTPRPTPGTIGWSDLTTDDAPRVRDFYAGVVGWSVNPIDMGGYADYEMKDASGKAVAGVCHRRGSNADIPPGWMIYIVVDDIEVAAERAVELGGSKIGEIKGAKGQPRMCVVKDPAGAVFMLYQA